VPRPPGPPPRPPEGSATTQALAASPLATVGAQAAQQPSQATAAAEGAGEPAERVAAALAGLDRLDSRPTGEHVAAFERVHVALTDALSAIDEV